MKLLRVEGKRDLYGLCSPVKGNETQNLLTTQCLNVLVLMAIVWVKHGVSFLKNLFHKQVISRQMTLTMKYILKMVKVAYSVSYGFL